MTDIIIFFTESGIVTLSQQSLVTLPRVCRQLLARNRKCRRGVDTIVAEAAVGVAASDPNNVGRLRR